MTWQPPPDDAPEPDRPDPGLGPTPPEPPSGPAPEPQPEPPPPSEQTPSPERPSPSEPPHSEPRSQEPPAEEPRAQEPPPSTWQNPPTAGQPPSDPYGHPQFTQPQYPQAQYPQYGYTQQAPGYPPYQAYPPQRGTNVLAIVALIVSIVLLPPLGAILGHISRRQIRSTGEGGDGVALAAIIIGWTLTGLGILIVVCVAVLVGLSTPNTTY